MRPVLMMAAVAAVLYGGYRWSADSDDTQERDSAQLVRDRVWIDHLPRHERDRVQLFVALSPRGPRLAVPIGVFEAVSTWEGHFEAFRYESHGSEMRVVFPQTGDRETLTVRARECNEHGMDYCLDIAGSSRGVQRYYSKKEWIIRSTDEARALVQQL